MRLVKLIATHDNTEPGPVWVNADLVATVHCSGDADGSVVVEMAGENQEAWYVEGPIEMVLEKLIGAK